MKKIISILIALVLALSLTACSGSSSGENNENKTKNPIFNKATLNKYVNEATLNNTDNITIYIGDAKNENEQYFLNINAPGLLNNLSTIEDAYGGSASRMVNEIINLRLFSNSDSYMCETYFTFKGYGEFIIKVQNPNSGLGINTTEQFPYETVDQDGCLKLERQDSTYYRVAANDGDVEISIEVEGLNGIRLHNEEEEITTLYNMMKEHFTFAKIKTKKVVKEGIEFTTYDLKNATILNGDKSSEVLNDWVFGCDVLYKELEEMGISLITSQCLTSRGSAIGAPIFFEATDGEDSSENANKKGYMISFSNINKEDLPSFDEALTENEFAIGNVQFRHDGKDSYHGLTGIGFIIKTKTGEEYSLSLEGRGSRLSKKLTLDEAKEVINKIFLK